jgi:hypothetical protein
MSVSKNQGNVPGFVKPSLALLPSELVTDRELSALQQLATPPPAFLGSLAFGSAHPIEQQVVFGAPCIRGDLQDLSVASVYQMLVPLLVASHYRLPCVLSLGVAEEQLIRPAHAREYEVRGTQIEETAHRIAEQLRVELTTVSTASPDLDSYIDTLAKAEWTELSPDASFNLPLFRGQNGVIRKHSPERIWASRRGLACHSVDYMKATHPLGERALIVEDAQQLGCWSIAEAASPSETNFLAFVPCLDLSGACPMTNASEDQRVGFGAVLDLTRDQGRISGFDPVLRRTAQMWRKGAGYSSPFSTNDCLKELERASLPTIY